MPRSHAPLAAAWDAVCKHIVCSLSKVTCRLMGLAYEPLETQRLPYHLMWVPTLGNRVKWRGHRWVQPPGVQDGRRWQACCPPVPWGRWGLPRAPLGAGCVVARCRQAPLHWAGLKIAGGMAGQGPPVGGPWGGAGRGGGRQPGPGTGSQWRWRSHPAPGGRPAAAQLTGYFFPCLTKYGQRAQPEGPLGRGACLGCLAGYIRTAKVRPAPDPRGVPHARSGPSGQPSPPLPFPPLPLPVWVSRAAGFACVSLHTRQTGPFCSPDLYLALTPARGAEASCRHSPGRAAQGVRAERSLPNSAEPATLRLPSLSLSQDLPPC